MKSNANGNRKRSAEQQINYRRKDHVTIMPKSLLKFINSSRYALPADFVNPLFPKENQTFPQHQHFNKLRTIDQTHAKKEETEQEREAHEFHSLNVFLERVSHYYVNLYREMGERYLLYWISCAVEE